MLNLAFWILTLALVLLWVHRRKHATRTLVGAYGVFCASFFLAVFVLFSAIGALLVATGWSGALGGLSPIQVLAASAAFMAFYWWFYVTSVIQNPRGIWPPLRQRGPSPSAYVVKALATLGATTWVWTMVRDRFVVSVETSGSATGAFIELVAEHGTLLGPIFYLAIRKWLIAPSTTHTHNQP